MICNHYSGRTRCATAATVKMFAQDGTPVPGGYYCRPHAEAAIAEYAEKLGQQWTSVDVDWLGTAKGSR